MNPTITAVAEVDSPTVALSGITRLTLAVEGPAPLRVEVPTPAFRPLTVAQWHIAAAGPPKVTDIAPGRQRWEQGYRLDPFEPGKLEILVAPVGVRAGAAPSVDVSFPSLEPVVVTTSNTGKLHPGTSIERSPERPPAGSPSLAPWLLVAVLVGVGWWRWRHRPKAQVLTPLEQANAGLRALAEQRREGTLSADEYLAALADVVRAYLEAAWDLPASRRTSPEVLTSERLPAEATEGLRRILEACDRAKFGGGFIEIRALEEVGVEASELIARLGKLGELGKSRESRQVG